MVVMRYAVIMPAMKEAAIGMKLPLSTFSFMLLILVAVLLTGAGNIINDYFDRKVDKINKPQNVIIGTKVKRRVAIVLHQSMNVLALFFTLIVCFTYSYYWPVIFPVFIATILWWYSPTLKMKFLIGNIAVAICTAAVPLWAVIFEMELLQRRYSDMLVEPSEFFNNLWIVIAAISFFAFLLTLIREVLKDMEDVQGDIEGGYNTLPIKKGLGFAKRYAQMLYAFYVMSIGAIAIWMFTYRGQTITDIIILLVLTLIPAVVAMIVTASANDRVGYHKASTSTKVVMLLGIIYLIVARLV